MAIAEFLSIPPNIKQSLVPFVLDPNNPICKDIISYADRTANGGTKAMTSSEITDKLKTLNNKYQPQFFTFKRTHNRPSETNIGYLTICPSSYRRAMSGALKESEVSFASLYDRSQSSTSANGSTGGSQSNSDNALDFQKSILDNIPSIKIREYLQDAKLNQALSLFAAVGAGWRMAEQQMKSGGSKSVADIAKTVYEAIKSIVVDLPTILKKATDAVSNVFNDTAKDRFSDNDDYSLYVVKIPYLLYYRMLTSFTTNIYEIPYSGNYDMTSKGEEGWPTTEQGEGGTSAFSSLGTFMNWFGKNLKIASTPAWAGSTTNTGSSYTITFNLINDTIDSAIINFIFINTLFPNNKWVQYHLYQHSPNLYDIQIAGLGRFMLCTGSFQCKGIGSLKKPSAEFFKRLASKHVNTSKWQGKQFVDDLQKNDLIRIPDAFELTLTFTSLMPDNFNTYLYRFTEQTGFETLEGAGLHNSSVFETVFKKISDEVEKRVKEAEETVNNALSEKTSSTAEYSPEDADADRYRSLMAKRDQLVQSGSTDKAKVKQLESQMKDIDDYWGWSKKQGNY